MYDFSRFDKCMLDLKQKSIPLPTALRNIQNELNRFFNDAKCVEVIFTQNHDKPFFGMSVIPTLPHGYLMKCIASEKQVRFDRYMIDIDSKLLDPLMNLSSRQLVAILLHEVGHVVNNTFISTEIKNAIHVEIARNGLEINYSKIEEAEPFLNVCVHKTIKKLYSFFDKDDEEYIADEFVVKCGYGKELESAYDKIVKNRDLIKGKQNAFLSLFWGLGLYKELVPRRTNIIHLLKSSEEDEPSTMVKRLYTNAINGINSNCRRAQKKYMSDVGALQEASFLQGLKYSSLKTLEEDLYAFKIRINSIDSQTEALDILKSINMRISLVEEYVTTNGASLSEKEKNRLFELSRKYQALRDEMVRKGSYDKQVYGLFVKYPQIHSPY